MTDAAIPRKCQSLLCVFNSLIVGRRPTEWPLAIVAVHPPLNRALKRLDKQSLDLVMVRRHVEASECLTAVIDDNSIDAAVVIIVTKSESATDVVAFKEVASLSTKISKLALPVIPQ